MTAQRKWTERIIDALVNTLFFALLFIIAFGFLVGR
jgi:hypothetical protein